MHLLHKIKKTDPTALPRTILLYGIPTVVLYGLIWFCPLLRADPVQAMYLRRICLDGLHATAASAALLVCIALCVDLAVKFKDKL